MDVAIVTVGDELLAGRTTNTNATWLAGELTDRGVTVTRILTVPDDRETIASAVRATRPPVDALVVTGGIGGTPDDVTLEGVADALGRELVVSETARAHIREKARTLRERSPGFLEDHDVSLDLAAAAAIPSGGEPIVVEAAWAPGCVVEDVYVLAGIPAEMQAMFETVADDFDGDRQVRTLYTPAPEGAIRGLLADAGERFPVRIGSYPRTDDGPGRVTVTATDEETAAAATAWLAERLETVDPRVDGGGR